MPYLADNPRPRIHNQLAIYTLVLWIVYFAIVFIRLIQQTTIALVEICRTEIWRL